ncbi:MAG: GNAT family N-acetyltransferase [Motilibacteraceae bacterium]
MTSPVAVTTGSLVLRPWRPEAEADIEAVLRAAQDPELSLWNGVLRTVEDAYAVSEPAARTAAVEWLARMADWRGGAHATWAVAQPPGDVVLGYVSLFDVDREQESAEVGYWTLPAARGRGVATAALAAAASFAFTELGLRRVMLFHAVENESSCRVAGRAGFAYEGLHRQSYRYGDGRWHDEHSHGRLRDDPLPPAVGWDAGPVQDASPRG